MNTGVKKSLMRVERETAKEIRIAAEPGRHLYEIYLLPFSKLRLSAVWNLTEGEENETVIRLILAENSECETMAAVFGNAPVSLTIENALEGAASKLSEKTLFFGSGRQKFSLASRTVLSAPRAEAEIESKGILADRAEGGFDGNIHIMERAKGASARLIEHTLLLSPDCRMNAIPGLKIDTNDVQASHSAGITRVDETQLFYCQARGVDETEAIRLIAEGYATAMIRDTPQEKMIAPLIREKICRL